MSSISIIIPNLNQVAKLDRCLNALVSQIGENDVVDILVVDNGSNDGSLEVIKKYNVTCLNYHEKKSPYAARNFGIKTAKGEIICLMDSKCLPSDSYIAGLIKQSQKIEWDVVGGKFYYIGLKDSSSIGEIAYSMLYLKTDPKYFSGRVSALTGNMVVKKSVFERIGYFDERRSGGDVEFTYRAYKNNLRLDFNEKLMAGYEPQNELEIIESTIRNKRHARNKMKFYSIRPPGINFFKNRLTELDLSIGVFKQLRLYLFIWRLRFIKYFTRTISE